MKAKERFEKEIERLREGFLNFCLLWGLVFLGDDEKADDEKAIEEAIQFTRKKFPKLHSDLHFERVFGTLLYVATTYVDGIFVVRPEINTIYSCYSLNGYKHDLITPIIKALADDCLLHADLLQFVEGWVP